MFKEKIVDREDKYEESTNDKPKKDPREKYPILSVHDIIPVKEIYKGMIVTEDERYIKILEVLPINFALRSADEQDNIIFLFASWLKIAPARLQFKIITRRADSREIINNVIRTTEGETQPKCKQLANNYIRFIQNVSGAEALSRRFFLIYEYEPSTVRKRTIDDIAYEMEQTARRIRGSLAACGNEVIVQQNEDFFQAEALYLFYNKQSCVHEPFADRVMRVTEDVMRMQGLTPGEDPYPDVHVSNYIAPRGITFTHPDSYVCDGLYNSIYYIPRNGYPSRVFGGWMSALVEGGDGMDVDIILRKEDRTKVKENVSLKLKLNRIKANERNDTDTDFEEIEGAIYSASYIKASLANGEDFYNVYTFITVSAETPEELTLRKEALVSDLYARDIVVKEAKYRMEEAFQMATPLINYKKELMDFARRNIMTYGVASLYPFTSCEMCDDKGIVLGINRRYHSLVNLDIFNTKKYKNANIAILGTSGSGKTFCELTMALRMRIQGVQTFLIAPDKAHEYQRACLHIGGSYIRVASGSKACINVMEIRPAVSPIAEYLDEWNAGDNDSWLSQKASQLLVFFRILVPDLTNEEEQLVDEAIIRTYRRFNITHNNDSIYIPGTKTVKKMPIIGDLYNTLIENPDTKRVANILGRFVTGSASSFNQQTNVDLNNKFIVFDLQDLHGTMKAVGMFIVADFLYAKIKENRTERKAIFFDEGWQLISASADPSAAEFVFKIFKTIRGYGGSAIFATQDLTDLFSFQDGKYGKAIISNSKTKIILGMEAQEAQLVRETLRLTKQEFRRIINFPRGEALLCSNNNKMEVYIRASELETELITTDPDQLRELVENRRREREKERLAMQFSRTEYVEHSGDADEQDAAMDEVVDVPFTQNQWTTTPIMDEFTTMVVARDQDGSPLEMIPDQPLAPVDGEAVASLEEALISDNMSCSETINPVADTENTCAHDAHINSNQANDEPNKTTSKGGIKSYGNRPPAEF